MEKLRRLGFIGLLLVALGGCAYRGGPAADEGQAAAVTTVERNATPPDHLIGANSAQEVTSVSPTPAPTTEPGEWSDRCVGVTDGDTVRVMHNGCEEKVRLNGIDCPEAHQAFSTRAKQFTSQLIFNQVVTVKPIDIDKYGRTVADVYTADGSCVNEALVAAGFAWWYREYAPGNTRLEALEKQARLAHVGLWSDPNPIAPWDFRHGGSRNAPPTFRAPTDQQPATDGGRIVYYAPSSGKRYHSTPNCRGLSQARSVASCTLQQAKAKGLTPCRICGG